MGCGSEFELAAALAGVKGYSAVASWLVVFDGGRIRLADEGVVGFRSPWDKRAGAVLLTFVVVVTAWGLAVFYRRSK